MKCKKRIIFWKEKMKQQNNKREIEEAILNE